MNETNLSELWLIARRYGRVAIDTARDGSYHAQIQFNTIEHAELIARSGFRFETPEAALMSAISVACAIVNDVKKIEHK